MSFLFTNNATSTLASGITDSETSITVQSGHGARFPTPSGGDTFRLTLTDASNNIEIVDCTARSGDVLTIVRNQEGSGAKAYISGDSVGLRVTKEVLESLSQIVDAVMKALPAVKTAGNLTFNDDVQVNLGTGEDAEIYFDGTQVNIDLNGDIELVIRDGNSGNAARFTLAIDTGTLTVPNLVADSISGSGVIGMVAPFALAAPAGWLECDGTAVNRTTYAALFSYLGTAYGIGDGATTFNLPDLRGEFIRGFDNGAGNDSGADVTVTGDTTISTAIISNISSTANIEVGSSISGTGIPASTVVLSVDSASQVTIDQNATASNSGVTLTISNRTDRGDGTSGDVVGSKQVENLKSHTHTYNHDISAGDGWVNGGSSRVYQQSGTTSGATGGVDTRPRNVQMRYCIKT